MLFEITSSAIVGGIVGYTYLTQSGLTDEGKKIVRICENAGLSVKGESMRLLRRSRREWGTEFAYRIPLGLSLADYERKIDAIRDGLNARGTFDIRKVLTAIKRRDWRAIKGAKTAKDIELEYDGVLRVRVYENALPARYELTFEGLCGWQVIAGKARDGEVRHDFEKHPHLIVAGMTDYGKSVFLKNVITTLIARQSVRVRFHLIDLKGGLAFNRFRNLPQVSGIAKDPAEALEMLTEAQAKMNETIEYLLAQGFEDVKEAKMADRHFVIIDEAADISDDKACQAIIKDIARRGRGAGFRLIYATQYPTNETISAQVRQNASARLCFRLNTAIASRAVLDEEGAEKLPVGVQGRAIYSTDRKQTVQTPYVSNEFINNTIQPYITFKAREVSDNERNNSEGTTSRRNSLIVEEIGLS